MSLFDGELWSSDVKTDSLNDQLFGGSTQSAGKSRKRKKHQQDGQKSTPTLGGGTAPSGGSEKKKIKSEENISSMKFSKAKEGSKEMKQSLKGKNRNEKHSESMKVERVGVQNKSESRGTGFSKPNANARATGNVIQKTRCTKGFTQNQKRNERRWRKLKEKVEIERAETGTHNGCAAVTYQEPVLKKPKQQFSSDGVKRGKDASLVSGGSKKGRPQLDEDSSPPPKKARKRNKRKEQDEVEDVESNASVSLTTASNEAASNDVPSSKKQKKRNRKKKTNIDITSSEHIHDANGSVSAQNNLKQREKSPENRNPASGGSDAKVLKEGGNEMPQKITKSMKKRIRMKKKMLELKTGTQMTVDATVNKKDTLVDDITHAVNRTGEVQNSGSEMAQSKKKKQSKKRKISETNTDTSISLSPKKQSDLDTMKAACKATPTHSFSVDKLQKLLKITPKPLGKKGKGATEVTTAGERRGHMEQQLKAARFRYLNEQLYNITGEEALKLFKKDKEAFEIYHSGFQSQVEKWPVNPLDKMISFVKSRPKSHIIADFGCGDAKLAESVPQMVHSFDLVATSPRVTVCDMAHVPLEAETVDVAVFCLSLMGTNIRDFLCEANRIIKPGGTLLVAEIVSRFHKVADFLTKLGTLGFRKIRQEAPNNMFIWFEFRKTKTAPKRSNAPRIELKPCVYKKR